MRSACSPTSLGSSTVGHVHNELLNFHQGFLPSVLINTQYANMPLSMASITSLTFMASRFISSFSCSWKPLWTKINKLHEIRQSVHMKSKKQKDDPYA